MYFLYVLQYNLFFLILSLYYNFKIYFIKRLNKKNLKTENEKKKKKGRGASSVHIESDTDPVLYFF
jgi:hypothetical protein